MRKVAIVGIGTLPWRSRYADKSFRALGLEATKKAIFREERKGSIADFYFVPT